MSKIEVVGGIIRRGEKYLLGKRPPGKSQGGHWEFIGGKIEPGETPEQALARECMEEIALPIINAHVRTSVTHSYPDRTIHLTLIDCEPAPGSEPTAIEHSELGWFTASDMRCLDFCAADAELLPVLFGEREHFAMTEEEEWWFNHNHPPMSADETRKRIQGMIRGGKKREPKAEGGKSFWVRLLIGGTQEFRADVCSKVHFEGETLITCAGGDVASAQQTYEKCLAEKKSCVLDVQLSKEDRSKWIAFGRKSGAKMIALEFCRECPEITGMDPSEKERIVRRLASGVKDELRPELEEGFDEIDRVKHIDGDWRIDMFEKREPMREIRKDENGNDVWVELGDEYYMIERPTSLSCCQMSRAAFERLHKQGGQNIAVG